MLSGGILRRCFLVVRIHHPELHDRGRIGQVSSAGLRVMLSAQKTMNKQGSMTVRNASELVRSVFTITGMDSVINLAD